MGLHAVMEQSKDLALRLHWHSYAGMWHKGQLHIRMSCRQAHPT